MQTYSHYILTAYLNRKRKQKEATATPEQQEAMTLPAVASKAFLFGSIIPDLMLIAISAIVIGFNLMVNTQEVARENIGYFFDISYFQDWRIIAAHSLFHGPLVILAIFAIGWWGYKNQRPWANILIWFALGAGLHSFIDILTHYDDGPVLFFPFNWTYRFSSPVSYWDPNHYGNIFAPAEHILDLALIIYLVSDWWRQRKKNRSAAEIISDTAEQSTI